ncbi:MAG TPA: GNAT family N-acetyltransferase [Thermoanaerobaculia bacterium]|nr:GNAT family N-acetyltransferase [Thermoanaerobaculia bacterium]
MPSETSLDPLAIAPLASDAEAQWCARLMSSSEPWITLGRSFADSLERMRDPAKERYVARLGSVLAGFVVLNMQGAFVGYIQTICVSPEFRNRGIGTKLVEFAEKRIFPESPNVFICVSSFNFQARKLYERMGYKMVGALMDYVVRDHSELLLRKTTGPIAEFLAKPKG